MYGLSLLVSLLMIGMVAAMKGFNGRQGTELADLIVHKIAEAVNAIAFKLVRGPAGPRTGRRPPDPAMSREVSGPRRLVAAAFTRSRGPLSGANPLYPIGPRRGI